MMTERAMRGLYDFQTTLALWLHWMNSPEAMTTLARDMDTYQVSDSLIT